VAERDHRQRKTSFPAKRAWSPSSAPSWRSGKNKVTPGSSGVKVERQTKQQDKMKQKKADIMKVGLDNKLILEVVKLIKML
jgi:hypothetical protein